MNRASRARATALTELEGSVLGLIAAGGPCTPYAVRRELQASPSQYWSASAGAVYPLFARLERQGLVRASPRTGDGRGGKSYTLTPAGKRALRAWLGPPSPSTATGVPPDPLRSRVAFFGFLDAQERARFLADAVHRVREHIRELNTYTDLRKAEGDVIEYIVCRGAQRTLEARLDWLLETARTLGIELDESTQPQR